MIYTISEFKVNNFLYEKVLKNVFAEQSNRQINLHISYLQRIIILSYKVVSFFLSVAYDFDKY